jgi:hypothetical protein
MQNLSWQQRIRPAADNFSELQYKSGPFEKIQKAKVLLQKNAVTMQLICSK